jgi:hypothetical protein
LKKVGLNGHASHGQTCFLMMTGEKQDQEVSAVQKNEFSEDEDRERLNIF